jgi:hypothetical protein
MKPLLLSILSAALCLGQTFVPGGSGVAAAEGSSPCHITVATANRNAMWVLGTSNTTGVTLGVSDSLGRITFSSVHGPHNNGLSSADSLQVWQANLSATDASDVIRGTVSSTANWNSCGVVQYSSNSDTTLDQIAGNDITYAANLSTGVGVILTFKGAAAIKPRGQFARVQ